MWPDQMFTQESAQMIEGRQQLDSQLHGTNLMGIAHIRHSSYIHSYIHIRSSYIHSYAHIHSSYILKLLYASEQTPRAEQRPGD